MSEDKRRQHRLQGRWSSASSSTQITHVKNVNSQRTFKFDSTSCGGTGSMCSPGNFSWVEEGLIAGSAYPHSVDNLQFFVDCGIHYLVSLTQNKPQQLSLVPNLELVHIPIVDFTPPSIEQVNQFIALVESCKSSGKAAVVHCQLGRGRTGTMLACYMMKSRKMAAADAILEIRRIRPHSIETLDQELLVKEYEQYLQSLHTKAI